MMYQDYFKHIEDVSSSAKRFVSRIIIIAVYGLIGIYVLTLALSPLTPILPRMVNADNMMGDGMDDYGEI